ncbi:MAG: 4Fe-4S binding protein [Deltaproteobacteria bacterium]|nr:4Fe-4S binding protein [Deltaproteobacteria bacterium]MBW2129559.1 4Fe-4S binding protein [Deltaproteobacteria bacterium]MBW2302430.1 4Fe-4S binding protein [Deltaproteobacteria bacterium]
MKNGTELSVLKARAEALKARLDLLEKQIKRKEQGDAPPRSRVATVDPERCVACGICEGSCPAKAITVREVPLVDPQLCMGCGICVEQCPKGALSLLDRGGELPGGVSSGQKSALQGYHKTRRLRYGRSIVFGNRGRFLRHPES